VRRLVVMDIAPVAYSAASNPGWASVQGVVRAASALEPRGFTTRREVEAALAVAVPEPGVRSFVAQNLVPQEGGGFAWRVGWPGILAKNNILTDPSFYFAKNDPLYPATVPTVILRAGVAARNQMDTTFIASTISLEFVGGVKMSDTATTPVVYTRGLQTAGTWNGTTNATNIGVYKDTGGYIAYLGGNVNFHPNTTGIFTSNGNGNSKPTNILQAIPYSSVAANRSRIYGVNSLIGSAAGTVAVQGP
jgi:hypothetical protein